MAFAAWLYALSPNLIAHGSLVTMEAPLTVATAAAFLAFGSFLATGRRRWFWISAALCGLAFACKFTAIVYPPILGSVWWLRDRPRRTLPKAIAMAGFVAVMLAADFALTGFATLPLSPAVGEHPSATGRLGGLISRAYEVPIPQDWVGFATQMRHQASGGPSYLLGERRMRGWRYYYLIALAVKVPLAFWLLAGARLWRGGLRGCLEREPDRMPLQAMLLFFAIASIGSSRNYGVRYLLPMAPLAIVWLSRLAADGALGSRAARVAALSLGLLGQAVAVASVYPDQLTYFNVLAGGRRGGRFALADSNLDWGQGLRSLRRLQDDRPEFRDLTLYYFGDVDPAAYGVAGLSHVVDAVGAWPAPPPLESATTRYVAVSASLQYGPWGPDGFFRAFDRVRPVAMTDDATIAVHRNPAPVRLMSDDP
jgi:4-amino-4-deoxy-L-arabinose transferase-like glycosyltransferase